MSALPRMLRFVFIGTVLPMVMVGLYAVAALTVLWSGACQIGASCLWAGMEVGPFVARLNVLGDMLLFAGVWAGVGIALLGAFVVLWVKWKGR